MSVSKPSVLRVPPAPGIEPPSCKSRRPLHGDWTGRSFLVLVSVSVIGLVAAVGKASRKRVQLIQEPVILPEFRARD